MAPHISVRDYIRMPATAEPEEPTSTIVLTSSGNRFVDIRILLQDKTQEPLPQIATDAAIFPLTHLDWAFAGFSSSGTTAHVQDGSPLIKSVWKHWIDSRSVEAEEVKDEGFMFPQTDGRTLEKGSMVDGETGRVWDYEEMWRDVEGGRCGVEGPGGVRCVVLQMEGSSAAAASNGGEGEEGVVRGMVIRLGQYCQGVVRVGKAFALERWEWMGTGEKEGWKRRVRMGDLFLPCGKAMEHFDRLQLGGEVTHGESTWHVVELEEN